MSDHAAYYILILKLIHYFETEKKLVTAVLILTIISESKLIKSSHVLIGEERKCQLSHKINFKLHKYKYVNNWQQFFGIKWISRDL